MPDKDRNIRIVTAIRLQNNQAEVIAARFAEHFGINDYDVVTEVDPSLIGGMVMYARGYRYDYSIRGQLGRIAGRMKEQQPLFPDVKQDILAEAGKIRDSLSDALMMFNESPMAPGGQDIFWQTGAVLVHDEVSKDQPVVDQVRTSLEALDSSAAIDEIGKVIQIGDGVAYVSGIDNCRNSELIMFARNSYGIAMNLEEERVGVVILQEGDPIRQGMICKRTGMTVSVPAGISLLGRVVDALGNPIDGLGPILNATRRPVEYQAASIVDRQPVNRPLQTGITAIDAMTPIGRGQRELIIGDRQTGKTALAIDTIINQKGKNVYCIYVAIGQKMSTVAGTVNTLKACGAMQYTIAVVASASSSASLQYLAPFAGCAMAEELMYGNKADVLIVYDDLTKHAQAYRAISLLMRRPPGREAFPGDVFYLHARLLERAARMSDRLGGGSMTALPIVETQSGDISAYIPTNVISITDGQIYLETELFFAGQRPAINVGLSVSRVGGAAQTRAMKKVAGPLRINLAQYRELEAFSQFGSELDSETQTQLKIGERLTEVLKQPQYSPLPVEEQVIMLYLANKGSLMALEKEDVREFLNDFILHLRLTTPEVVGQIAANGEFTDDLAALIDSDAKSYLVAWQAEHSEYGTAL